MISMALSLPTEEAVARSPPAVTMDEAVFRCLYQRTASPLRAYLLRAGGSAALADDLLQESYLRFLRSGFEGESEQHRRNYLFRIATNLLRDHFRRSRPEVDEIPEPEGNPSHDEAVLLRSDVGRAMAGLAPRDRQMLWLAYVEGASHREIADVLGLRSASIRSMLSRARHRLAARLHAMGFRPRGDAP
jgi:RNA polymerase sigma-70 factor (ECF subfamily)